jgi:hypothetical protein
MNRGQKQSPTANGDLDPVMKITSVKTLPLKELWLEK